MSGASQLYRIWEYVIPIISSHISDLTTSQRPPVIEGRIPMHLCQHRLRRQHRFISMSEPILHTLCTPESKSSHHSQTSHGYTRVYNYIRLHRQLRETFLTEYCEKTVNEFIRKNAFSPMSESTFIVTACFPSPSFPSVHYYSMLEIAGLQLLTNRLALWLSQRRPKHC
jgi:hypothetical protein